MTTQTQIILEDWPVAVPGSLVVWRKRLVEARERGSFTDQDEHDMRSFHSCAVGELLGFPENAGAAIEMLGGWGAYKRHPLYGPGCRAKNTVNHNDFDGFEAILTELEALPRP